MKITGGGKAIIIYRVFLFFLKKGGTSCFVVLRHINKAARILVLSVLKGPAQFHRDI